MIRPVRLRLPAVLVATTFAVGLAAAAPARADRFSENLLKDGTLAAERGDAERAAKLLRLACFGLLEEPPALAGCLVHLALAEAGRGDNAALLTAVDRLVEVEDRFQGYARMSLDAATRGRFEELLHSSEELEERATVLLAAPRATPRTSERGELRVVFRATDGAGRVAVYAGGQRIVEREFDTGGGRRRGGAAVAFDHTELLAEGIVELRVVVVVDGRREVHDRSGNVSAAVARTLHISVPASDASGAACEVKFE